MKLLFMRKSLGFFLALSFVISSCSDDKGVMPDLNLDYYPLHVGDYSIFQMEETSISFSVETKILYELKVTVTDSTSNEQGVVTYFLLREKRATSTADWQHLDTWSSKVLNNKLIQNESNVLFVKLIFPPSLNVMWNGNEFNNLTDGGNLYIDKSSDQYVITQFNAPLTLTTNVKSDQTLTVAQNNFNDDIIGVDQRKEVYAKKLGLIYKEVSQLQYCNSSNCLGQRRVDKGFILKQSLLTHGKI